MDYILGLDLGTASLGWAMLECNEKGDPFRIERTGVRIFEAGVEGTAENIAQGRDSSRAAARREARAPRRQNWRTQRRKQQLFTLLQQHGLLPSSEKNDSDARKAVFDELDAELRKKHITTGDHAAHQHLPYLLRTKALTKKLEPFELGRALYNLAQRRGFLSNRKTDTDEKEDGVVKGAISELGKQMGDRTLAQTFVEDVHPDNGNPEQQKIRKRYTAREMFHDEFNRIREQQQPRFSFSDNDWSTIYRAIFFQRPLMSQRHRIGKCEIDGGQRCLDALDAFQQFRIWNSVQNLRLAEASLLGRDARLTLREQQTIVDALQSQSLMTWSKVHKLVGLKGAMFTIQEWTKDRGLVGHRTNAEMIKVFGDEWLDMPLEQRDAITKEVVYFRRPSAMKRRGRKAWNLSADQADLLPGVKLEEGHARHSAKTLAIFVDRMSNGQNYSTIRTELTGKDESEALARLPPLGQAGLDITNPGVIRGLTELRKVVNELIRDHGKPVAVHIEMARELKNSRDKRIKLHKNNEDRRKRREKAIEGILDTVPRLKYSGTDIEKWLLADECGWHCPYTGKSISPKSLFSGQFDIEHIWPRRYLDNSYTNKTLCCNQFNRDVKGNRTAFDACSGRDDWDEILQRVSSFDGPVAALKKKRFLTGADEIPDDFTSKHLNDTRYNAVVAGKYLAMLYGGLWDTDGKRRIFAVTGGHTAQLRREWGLNGILSGTTKKTRDDHRHHAVDAVVIGLTDPKRVQALVAAAELAERKASKRFYEAVQDPWPRFSADVEDSISQIVVSHRPTRTLPGALHAESIYSKAHVDKDGKQCHRIRKHITKLSATELKKDKIADPKIRALVNAKLEELGERNPMKAFAEEKNHPFLTTRDGRQIPIHKVRVDARVKPVAVGNGSSGRFVDEDGNAALLIGANTETPTNAEKWTDIILTRLTVHQRLSQQKESTSNNLWFSDNDEFPFIRMVLFRNDMIELDWPERGRIACRIQNISQGDIQLCEHNQTTGPKRSPWRVSAEALRKRNALPITISPTGKIRLS